MNTVSGIADWQGIRNSPAFQNRSIGFVPTMGALHKGHLSLIKRCLRENDVSVVSIFLNPTQFNDPADLKSYPLDLEKDRKILEQTGVQFLFIPKYEDLYPDNYHYRIIENDFSTKLCGAHRPGHFDGVLTVVMKLLNLVRAHRNYFGEKDYQQYLLIREMVKAFFMDTEIIPCPVIRESDGLALSSRNTLLTPAERKIAPQFPRLLQSDRPVNSICRELEKRGFEVDYITEMNRRRYGAVIVGKVRLIDNVPI